jgi:hypothetical protein
MAPWVMPTRTLVLALLLLSPNCYAQTTSATPVKPAIAEKTAEQKKRDDLYARAGFYIWRYRGEPDARPSDEQPSDGEKERDKIRSRNPMPALLICKTGPTPDSSGPCDLHWGSDTLHSHYIMEQIRADIVWFRTGHRTDLIDPGKELWTAARDIFCQEQPAAKYIDLDGVSRVCGTN